MIFLFLGMGLLDSQQCTYFQNTICHCKEGYFCVERKGNGCEMCRKYSLGPVGEGVKKKGTIWEDAVYEKCRDGTYSNNVSTEACKPWTKCKELNKHEVRPGNPSMDAECKEKMNIAFIVLSIVIPVVIGGVLGILWWKRRDLRKCTVPSRVVETRIREMEPSRVVETRIREKKALYQNARIIKRDGVVPGCRDKDTGDGAVPGCGDKGMEMEDRELETLRLRISDGRLKAVSKKTESMKNQACVLERQC
uniref:TNFR-Cys domain-containing protein n=1 Tax=Callorhinchus milii TaxID=7868 RepID=A0A4W3GB17_CALMI